jgi:cysteinyl-tRNA synthetase
MQASQVSYDRFIEGALQHKDGVAEIPRNVLESFLTEFEDAINDDLNIPKALGIAWNMVRYSEKSKGIYELLLKMDDVFGLGIKYAEQKSAEEPELDAEIERLIEERQQARKEKNWKLSDEIRDKLKEMGIELQDTPQGVKWKRI